MEQPWEMKIQIVKTYSWIEGKSSCVLFFKFVSSWEVFPNKEEREILSLAVRFGGEDCEWADELRLKEVWRFFLLFYVYEILIDLDVVALN